MADYGQNISIRDENFFNSNYNIILNFRLSSDVRSTQNGHTKNIAQVSLNKKPNEIGHTVHTILHTGEVFNTSLYVK